MNITTENLDEFLDEFGIIKVDENCYLVPENEDIEYDEENETHGFEVIDFSKLVVNDGDTLVVTLYEHTGELYDILDVYNVDTYTTGYIKGYYFSDDGRYYLCCSVAEYFKDKNVKVCNYLYFDKEETVSLLNYDDDL